MEINKPIEMREMVAADVELVAPIFVACFSRAPWNEPWTLDAAARRLRLLAGTPTFRGAVAMGDGRAVALAMGQVEGWWEGNLFILQEMCVSPNLQRSGLGARLLDHLLARVAETDEVRSCYLLTDASSAAESFYLRRGFRPSKAKIVLGRGLGRRPR